MCIAAEIYNWNFLCVAYSHSEFLTDTSVIPCMIIH
jgi:hypothetical protein